MSFEELASIIREVVDNNDLEIHTNSLIREDLGLCSFDMMLIVGIIEQRYNKSLNSNYLVPNLTMQKLFSAID